ncbi:hypothetical protein BDBG_17071 [Blastomyces gilchristii SLH14081]|uniref:C2H2-type domain-containing protein n=1 Tax=Blastomyces gilchristii (strain SLH14081) TaxID=559298 RepID=A0A179UKJ8_BLAGS|nr:uncharacterized protein BDBG_17071 [Blastomyces gilchristii SLH14081]OAT08575.1 hypothetical protein BDBG_17071 [Blastomyces gilchristii SLH14081]
MAPDRQSSLALQQLLQAQVCVSNGSGLPKIFLNNASDSDSSTAPSDFDYSSEPESESDDESEDELALEDEEEQLSPEYYLQEAESLDVSQLRQKRYSPKTQERLDEAQDFWDRWDITAASSHTGLGSLIVLGSVKAQSAIRWNVHAIVATEKKLSLKKRPKATMFIEDVAEFARVILTTTEMTFLYGWYRIQLLLFCQLAAITGSRPGALLKLRFVDLKLTLIRDPKGGRPRLFIYLRPEFTKSFLGEKESDTFPIPEIIFDPTLVLSPHVFLLGMLFRIGAFKSLSKDGPVADCPEKLYNLWVLDGLGEQELKLKDELLDQHVVRLRALRKPRSHIVFDTVQQKRSTIVNVMLQHASIDTFVRHYSVGIHVDAQAIVRGLPAEKQLIQFACSMSRSIDPRRPYRLEDSSCINDIPRVCALEDRKQAKKRIQDIKMRTYENAQAALQQEFGDNPQSASLSRTVRKRRESQEKSVKKLHQKFDHADEQYDRSRRQKHRLIRENLEQYKNEQPVINSEQQLAGKVVDKEVMGALQHTGYMTMQHMTLIDSILTMPGTTVKKEYERRIAAINAVIAVCDAEEGAPSRPGASQKHPVNAVDILPAAPLPKRQKSTPSDKSDDTFSRAVASVCVKSLEERPKICFICLGNARLPEGERLRMYKNPGSLSRHFVNKHIKPFPNDMHCECQVCGEKLISKSGLLNHAERVHGTVSCLPLPALGLPLP